MNNINEQFKRLRLAQGMSKTKLAEMSGISRITIYRFETHNSNIQIQTLARLLECLDGGLLIYLDE